LGIREKYPLKVSVIEDGIAKNLGRSIWDTVPWPQEFVGRRAEMDLGVWIAKIEQPGDLNVDSNQDDRVRSQPSYGAKRHASWDIGNLVEELIPFSISRFKIERSI